MSDVMESVRSLHCELMKEAEIEDASMVDFCCKDRLVAHDLLRLMVTIQFIVSIRYTISLCL